MFRYLIVVAVVPKEFMTYVEAKHASPLMNVVDNALRRAGHAAALSATRLV
jgi:hypothetical protein